MDINQTVAMITGGASGMGRASAELLISLGAKVAILDINQAVCEETANKIGAIPFTCDVTQAESVENVIKAIEKQLGTPRICINCAGVVHGRRMVNQQGPMPLDEFRKIIEINLIGSFNVMRLIANAMTQLSPLADEERGVIINTASVAAFEGQIGQTAYSASKGGIVGLTLPAARELAQFGIRVMTIAPGLVDTPMFEKISPEARASLAASVPFPKRLAKPQEYALLAKAIIENPMLNGNVIRLDGALRMAPK
ncbi:MAG: SDR family NAD(P)-dependent oxidoreductase [Gammaproteobacteria bacterium]|nr:SDR family NAD(P)-dependent oxidoreductase [Gammaproteobacteria bacterium]